MSFSEAMLPLEGFAYQCEPDSSHPFKEKTKCKLVFSKSPQNRGHQLVIGDKITLPLTPDHLAVIALLKTSTMLKRTQECLFLLVRNSTDDFKPYAFASEEKHESMIQLDEWRQKIQKAVFGEDRYNNKYMVANEREIRFNVHSTPRYTSLIPVSENLQHICQPPYQIYQRDGSVRILEDSVSNAILIKAESDQECRYTCVGASRPSIINEFRELRRISSRDPSSPLPVTPPLMIRRTNIKALSSSSSELSLDELPTPPSRTPESRQAPVLAPMNIQLRSEGSSFIPGDENNRPTPAPRPRTLPRKPQPTPSACGEPPPFDQHPFYKDIYNKHKVLKRQDAIILVDDVSFPQIVIAEFAENRRKTRVQKLSDRSSKFFDKYQLHGPMNEANGVEDSDYADVLRINIEAVVAPVKPLLPPTENASTIESTLYDISFGVPSPLPDPFQLTHTEKCKFFYQLHFLEVRSVKQEEGGWQRFAELAIGLDNDELTMIDEYNARHNVPVLKIVLRHWQKLSNLNSDKVLYRPCKESIIRILWSMQKLSLLENLGWLSWAQTLERQ